MVGVVRREVAEDSCDVSIGVRLATEVGVEAVVKLYMAHRMLKVRGDTIERVKCSPAVNRGLRVGHTEIQALRRTGPSLAMVLRSLGVGEVDFGVLALRALVELL